MNNSTFTNFYIPTILAYFSLSVITYLLLFQFGYVEHLPNSTNLNSGDSGFYHSIMKHGYHATGDYGRNSGFFPLFAYLWRLTPFSFLGISILNLFIFLCSFSFLCKILQPDRMVVGLFMASPYLFFLWAPLSEALFFFFSVALIYGILKNNWKIIFVSVLLASTTRAIFLFFIPAFVGMALMSQPINEIFKKELWGKIIGTYLFPCFLGVSAVVLFQYFQTGEWFIYFKLQTEVWGRSFAFPTFPLGYNTPHWNLQGSYISFWIGMMTAAVGLKFLLDWFRKKDILGQIKNYELFSVIFICMSLCSILFFNATWSWNWNPDTEIGFMSTHFTGINRYIHPTVFFFVLLNYVFGKQRLTWWQYLGFFILTNLVWLCFDAQYYLHIQRYLIFLVPTLVAFALGLYHTFRWKILGAGIILASFILQSIIFNHYLNLVQVD